MAKLKMTSNQREILNSLSHQIVNTLRNKEVQTTLDFMEVEYTDAAALRGLKQRGIVTYRRVRNQNGYSWGYGRHDYMDIKFTGKGWREYGLERVFRAHQQLDTQAISKLQSYASDLLNVHRYAHNTAVATKDYEVLLRQISAQQTSLTKLKTGLEELKQRIDKLKKAKPTKAFQAKIIAAMMGV